LFSVTQRKHLERDLAALGEKIMTLGQEAARLCGIHPHRADQISAKCQEIVNNWETLTVKAKVPNINTSKLGMSTI
jgi:spectrin alpha